MKTTVTIDTYYKIPADGKDGVDTYIKYQDAVIENYGQEDQTHFCFVESDESMAEENLIELHIQSVGSVIVNSVDLKRAIEKCTY